MLIDSVTSGSMIEIRWSQRALFNATEERIVHAILLNPVIANIGTMEQRLSGWNCHIIYDSHARKNRIAGNKYYEIKWLKMCERQGNLKIISEANKKDEK